MHRARVAFIGAVVGLMVVACQQRHDPNDMPVYPSTASPSPSSAARSSSANREANPNEWVVHVRLVSVRPSAAGVAVRELPPVGERVNVRGDMQMKVLSAIEALARTGNDFSARANVGDTQMSLTGRLTRAGGDVEDMYRLSLSFRQTDPSGTTEQSTTLEVRPDDPRMVAGFSGGRGIVLTLRRPGAAEDEPAR